MAWWLRRKREGANGLMPKADFTAWINRVLNSSVESVSPYFKRGPERECARPPPPRRPAAGGVVRADRLALPVPSRALTPGARAAAAQ